MPARRRSRSALRPKSWAAAATLVVLVLLASPAAGQPSSSLSRNNSNPDQLGEWGPLLQWNMSAMHSILLHTGKVLIIEEVQGTATNPNACRIFDPTNDTVGPKFRGPEGHDLFCAGHSQMPDGRILFAGGFGSHGIGGTSIYDPVASSPWSTPDVPPPAERFYPTCTTLGNGKVLVTAGYDQAHGGSTDCAANTPNTFDGSAPSNSQWYDLQDARYRGPDNTTFCPAPVWNFHLRPYPFMFQLSNGQVLYCGSDEIGDLDTSAKFSRLLNPVTEMWSTLFGAEDPIAGGSAVHHRPDVVIKAGGFAFSEFLNDVYKLDMSDTTPSWQALDEMSNARRNFYLIVLPDGQILAIGGESGVLTYVMEPEIIDPEAVTPEWRTLAPMAVERLYHSSAVLLPDARVLIGGGEGHTSGQVFSPPYLFNSSGQLATRPVIISVASQGVITYGSGFTVTTNTAPEIERVSLIRLGAATHSFDHDQRFIPLEFTAGSTSLDVAAPTTGDHAPPGYYMLFIVNNKGVPSVAQIVKLQS